MTQETPNNLSMFAWNGVSFQVPKLWELSINELSKGVARIVLEDDFGPRLEVEWTVPKSIRECERFRKSSLEYIKAVTEKSGKVTELDGVPEEWTAHHYQMADRLSMIAAYLAPPQDSGKPFVFFRFHFPKGVSEVPGVCSRGILKSFDWKPSGLASWRFYDVDFHLDRAFRLTLTSLLAGQKLIAFEWRLRRLFIWHFSMADYILKSSTPAKWCADFLNKFKQLPAPRWSSSDGHTLSYSRKKLYCLGQFEEIGRLCYKYYAACRLLPESNQIQLCVFNYRKQSDLNMLAPDFYNPTGENI